MIHGNQQDGSAKTATGVGAAKKPANAFIRCRENQASIAFQPFAA